MDITPVQRFADRFVKRDDLAFYESDFSACGSKVRQYMQMIEQSPGCPLIVGCSAISAQQIYVADAGQRTGRRAIVVVPSRKTKTIGTRWAESHGAEIVEVSPGYPAVYRKRAREIAAEYSGGCVRWNPVLAVVDTMRQCQNVPADVEEVVVAVGSGLVCAGVLAGLAGRRIRVLGVAVSDLAKRQRIVETAAKFATNKLPRFRFIRHPAAYDEPVFKKLPDGVVLDPFYAAKCLDYVRAFGLLWITGRRPIDAIPEGQ